MRNWRLWVGIVFSAVFLALALTGIEWGQVWQAFRQADWRYLLVAAAMLVAFLVARAVRWRILLGPTVHLREAFAVTNIGYLVSNVLPLRLGDPARGVAIGLGGRVKVSAALTTVVVERVLDMLIVVLLLAFTLPFVGEAGWLRSAGLAGGLAGAIALAVLVTLALRPAWSERALRWVLRVMPRLDEERWVARLHGFLEGLAALRSPRRATGLLGWSVVIWMCSAGFYFGVLRAFIARPTLVQAVFLTCAIGLGVALPSSPGAMGVFHSVARYALQLPFGVANEQAVAIAFTSHALNYVLMSLLGLAGLLDQNLSLSALRSGVSTSLAKE